MEPVHGPSSSRDLLSEVSHKLRTPLTVIVSTVNNFLDGAFGAVKPTQREWLERLLRHSRALEGYVETFITTYTECAGAVAANSVAAGPAAEPRKTTGTTAPARRDRPPLVLVVDDEPDIIDTIQTALGMKGFETVSASDGPGALAMALKVQPDLVLMDVHLHEQSGLDVCRQLKASSGSYTPVLLITGQGDLSMVGNGQTDEPDDLLIKPFQIAELLSRVTSMLRIKQLQEEVQKSKGQKAA